MLTRLKRISGELSCDTPQVNDCPGEVPCSGFGYCDSVTYTCSCQDGYSGADCSLMTCPKGRSWFSYPTDDDFAHLAMTECSDMGKCNVDYGECECALGFEGAACQYLSCPGEAPCSDHGECLSMKLLAEAATENGAPIRAFSIRFKGRGGGIFSVSSYLDLPQVSGPTSRTERHQMMRSAGILRQSVAANATQAIRTTTALASCVPTATTLCQTTRSTMRSNL